MKKYLVFFAVISLVLACNPKAAEAVDTTAKAEFPSTEISTGHTIFQAKCTKCHDAKVIKNYSKERWDVVLPKMIVKAELNEEEANFVRTYIYWELEK